MSQTQTEAQKEKDRLERERRERLEALRKRVQQANADSRNDPRR